jgi:CHU_C Type IX secretion signal domain
MKGEPLTFNVLGSDIDNTNILLRGDGIGFNAASYGINFPSDFDQGSVASTFAWELTCDSINYEESNPFYFQVTLIDSLNKCRFYKADTLIVAITVEPPESQTFTPPNVFSPNKTDDLNSFFAMVKYDDVTEEFVNILPEDDCFRKFVSIQIYDRWGKQVFESLNRDFRWYGEGMPVGVYYYSLKFSDREYRGIVSIRF